MAFWKRLLGLSEKAPPQVTSTAPETPASSSGNSIESLVERAQAFYPHKNTAGALQLFLQAIELAGPAPSPRSDQEARDIDSAFWMAWVCLDMLERPTAEIDALLSKARVKSPKTAQRIDERIAASSSSQASEAAVDEALRAIESAGGSDSSRLQASLDTLVRAGVWWRLRDAGIALSKQGEPERAWAVLSAALTSASHASGGSPSVHAAMGDLRKAQKLPSDAARCYLLSCLSGPESPVKRTVNQLRISIKGAGIRGDAAGIRDELLAMRGTASDQEILDEFDRHLSSAGGND